MALYMAAVGFSSISSKMFRISYAPLNCNTKNTEYLPEHHQSTTVSDQFRYGNKRKPQCSQKQYSVKQKKTYEEKIKYINDKMEKIGKKNHH